MTDAILAKTINLDKLLKNHPELFDLSKLDAVDKIKLISYDPKRFLDLIVNSASTTSEKIEILAGTANQKVHQAIVINEDELESLSPSNYTQLLRIQFKKYIKIELFNKLSSRSKSILTGLNPQWVFENISPIPALTKDTLNSIAFSSPQLIKKYITDFLQCATTAQFWIRMIRFNPEYKYTFLLNTKSLYTKSCVRTVVRTFPEIIKHLNGNIIFDSKLTVKEWILLSNSVIEYNKDDIFTNWNFSDELKEIFKIDSLADVLSGKSKMSRQFSNAMNAVLSKDIPDHAEINETETI